MTIRKTSNVKKKRGSGAADFYRERMLNRLAAGIQERAKLSHRADSERLLDDLVAADAEAA